jgi:hypothetical protein
MAANTNSTIARRAPTTLATLPNEAHVAIFAELDPISSLSLGLACPELVRLPVSLLKVLTSPYVLSRLKAFNFLKKCNCRRKKLC